MQFDRLLMKTVARVARGGLGIRKTEAEAPVTQAPDPMTPKDDLRGSGSWANEWGGAKSAVQRAKSFVIAGKVRKADPAKITAATSEAADNIPEGSIRVKPLMSTRDVKLHNWILDRLEAEAPTCSLHAGVALNTFLVSNQTRPGFDPLEGHVADMVIADSTGSPLIVLIRENRADPAKQLILLDALLDSAIPVVDVPERPSLSTMWGQISEHLPKE